MLQNTRFAKTTATSWCLATRRERSEAPNPAALAALCASLDLVTLVFSTAMTYSSSGSSYMRSGIVWSAHCG
jgi:hypothetical protein